MQEAEEEAKHLREAKEAARAGEGTADEEGGVDEAAEMHLDPAAKRALRRQRLINEQRKRIEDEEKEKAEVDASIRSMQSEVAKLDEANGRLRRKVEACEHNIDETRDAIEDMAFQTQQCIVQKENALSVLTGETAYLTEHQGTVQRKASELTSKMTEIESAISASGYKLQRVRHTNELATADRRRELEALTEEASALKAKFERVRDDVRVLYEDKARLHQQLESAQAQAADAEACVTQYRRSVANLIA
jgi:predicted  nucleic acid-binding Zn-ribbon protein